MFIHWADEQIQKQTKRAYMTEASYIKPNPTKNCITVQRVILND